MWFLNIWLQHVRSWASPLGKQMWKHWLCWPIGLVSLAAGESPAGLGEELEGRPVCRGAEWLERGFWSLSTWFQLHLPQLSALFPALQHPVCCSSVRVWPRPFFKRKPRLGWCSQDAKGALTSFILRLVLGSLFPQGVLTALFKSRNVS